MLVAKQPPITDADAVLIDDLARRRCQCLMSVDDANAAIVVSARSPSVSARCAAERAGGGGVCVCACEGGSVSAGGCLMAV